MGAGRFVCVALPLVLTTAAIIALLVATLSGVTHTKLFLFEVDTTNVSISVNDIASLAGRIIGGRQLPQIIGNISAADLGLANKYEVNLWGYCTTTIDGRRECTKAQFDWASSALNTSFIEQLTTLPGVTFKIPNEIKSALETFRTVTKYTEVAFIVALVALGLELGIGIFANFSRAVSCCTWLFAAIATIFVGIAASLATAMATVVVAAIDSTAKAYGARGTVGGNFLAAAWVATAFAIGAVVFWIFTICCCKPDHSRKMGRTRFLDKTDDNEKMSQQEPYRPVSGNNYDMHGAHNNGVYDSTTQQYHHDASGGTAYPAGNGRTDMAYEPYSHRA